MSRVALLLRLARLFEFIEDARDPRSFTARRVARAEKRERSQREWERLVTAPDGLTYDPGRAVADDTRTDA